MTPEGIVLNDILKYLNELKKAGLPIFFERRQAGGFNYKKGMPDIYVVFNGRHIEIEAKRIGGQQSVMQEKRQFIFTQINIDYLLVDDVNQFKRKFLQLMEKYS